MWLDCLGDKLGGESTCPLGSLLVLKVAQMLQYGINEDELNLYKDKVLFRTGFQSNTTLQTIPNFNDEWIHHRIVRFEYFKMEMKALSELFNLIVLNAGARIIVIINPSVVMA